MTNGTLFLIVLIVLVVVALMIAGVLRLPGADRTSEERERWLIVAGALLAAGGTVFRDAETLQVLDNFSLLAMGALWAWHARTAAIARFELEDAVRAGLAGARP